MASRAQNRRGIPKGLHGPSVKGRLCQAVRHRGPIPPVLHWRPPAPREGRGHGPAPGRFDPRPLQASWGDDASNTQASRTSIAERRRLEDLCRAERRFAGPGRAPARPRLPGFRPSARAPCRARPSRWTGLACPCAPRDAPSHPRRGAPNLHGHRSIGRCSPCGGGDDPCAPRREAPRGSVVKQDGAGALCSLRSRIEPHLLCNPLGMVAGLVRSDPAAAEPAGDRPGGMLRRAFDRPEADMADALVPLGEEMRLARDHPRVEALRLGDRLRPSSGRKPGAEDWRVLSAIAVARFDRGIMAVQAALPDRRHAPLRPPVPDGDGDGAAARLDRQRDLGLGPAAQRPSDARSPSSTGPSGSASPGATLAARSVPVSPRARRA